MDGTGILRITSFSNTPKLIVNLVVAYLRAVERFRSAATVVSEPDGQLQGEQTGWEAMAEALNWADAIDENLRANDRSRPKGADWTDDLPDDSRRLWLGLQHARNAVHHQWWEAVALQMEVRPEGQNNTLVWAPLPEPKRRPSAAEEASAEAYVSGLRGRPILETLDELAAVMWPLRKWGVSRADLVQPQYGVGTPIELDPDPPWKRSSDV